MKDKEQNREVMKVIGLLAGILLLAILGQFAVGCCPRTLPPAEIDHSERVEIRERIVHDTAYVEIPKIKEVIVTRDSSSHLENDYASSDAAVIGGLLHHSLESRPQRIYVPVEVTVHDTLTVEKEAATIIQRENYTTRWQDFQIVLGRILGALLVVGLLAWAARKLIIKN